MFEELTELPPSDQETEFISSFERFTAGIAWNNEQMSKGVNISADLPRFRRLEVKIDALWAKMPLNRQRPVLEALCASGALPGRLLDILDMFYGKVVKIT